ESSMVTIGAGKRAITVSMTSPGLARTDQPLNLHIDASDLVSEQNAQVTVMDGSDAIATLPLVYGGADFSTAGLAPGTHTLRAVIAESDDYFGSESAPLMQVVKLPLGATTTTLTAAKQSVTNPELVNLTVQVSSTDATRSVNSGRIVIWDEQSFFYGNVVPENGLAQWNVYNLNAGQHTFK